jgi:cell filamentation protein
MESRASDLMGDGFGRYEVYAVTGSIYCYKDCNVLRNKFDIQDAATLRKIETDLSMIRHNDLLINPIRGKFTLSKYMRK